MDKGLLITLISIATGVTGWLLVQLWNLFKETRDDVKKLLLESASRSERIKQIEHDINHIYEISEGQDSRLQNVEKKIEVIIQKQ